MKKASSKGLSTRARILRAALDVLIEQGFANLTIKAVADKAGIAYGNLTYHYPAKDTLITGMLELWLEDYRHELDLLLKKALKATASPIPSLVDWLVEDAMTK
ncbi:MAG: TetR/AcrR family transcriptional regulator, partial [Gammaproteobacteria bacterium]